MKRRKGMDNKDTEKLLASAEDTMEETMAETMTETMTDSME